LQMFSALSLGSQFRGDFYGKANITAFYNDSRDSTDALRLVFCPGMATDSRA